MNTSRLMAGASRFAHLAGFSRKTRAADDDDRQDDDEPKGKKGRASDDDDKDDDDQPKGKKGRRAEDDDDRKDDDEPKGKKGRASDDDDKEDDGQPKGKKGRRAEDDDDDKGDDDEPKSKKGRASDDDDSGCDDDDDDKDEMSGKSAKAQARQRERERIGAILGHSAASRNLPLAVSLAVETTLTRREAINVLRSQRASAAREDDDEPRNRHARPERASRNRSLGGDIPELTGRKAADSSWGRAFEKAGVKTSK